MKILLLEDDALLGEIIKEHLQGMDHDTVWVENGLEAENQALSGNFDMWLFDINVPGLDGFELLEGLRRVDKQTPAIYISAQNQAQAVSQGFALGADDYLKKPFEMVELEARIGYIQKRLGMDEVTPISASISFDRSKRHLLIEGKIEKLSPKESALLYYFLQHPKQVHSHETLCDAVWGLEDAPTDTVLRTYIKKLRQLLGREMIATIHGEGYSFEI